MKYSDVKAAIQRDIFVRGKKLHAGNTLVGKEYLTNQLCQEAETEWKAWKNSEGAVCKAIFIPVTIEAAEEKRTSEDLFWELWKKVAEQMKQYIEGVSVDKFAEKIRKRKVVDYCDAVLSYRSPWAECKCDIMKDIFEELSFLGVQVILMVNRFHNAKMDVGTDTAGFFTYLFDISPKIGKEKEYALTVLLVSEENVEQVAQLHLKDGSRLSAAYPELVLE